MQVLRSSFSSLPSLPKVSATVTKFGSSQAGGNGGFDQYDPSAKHTTSAGDPWAAKAKEEREKKEAAKDKRNTGNTLRELVKKRTESKKVIPNAVLSSKLKK